MKGKLKQKYPKLSDDDLISTEGRQDELVGPLQEKLGQSRHEGVKEIKSL